MQRTNEDGPHPVLLTPDEGLGKDPMEVSTVPDILSVLPCPGTPAPIESDLEDWARSYVLSPLSPPRYRRIVAELLAEVESQR